MRDACLCFALILALAFAVCGQEKKSGRAKMSREAEAVIALDHAWANAQAQGDAAAMERLLSDDLIITSSTGTLRGKAEELNNLKPDPDLKTYFFKTDETRVRVYGSAAVLTGRARWRINYKGRDIDNEMRYTSVYAKEQGRWRMVALQLTRPVPPPAPKPSP